MSRRVLHFDPSGCLSGIRKQVNRTQLSSRDDAS